MSGQRFSGWPNRMAQPPVPFGFLPFDFSRPPPAFPRHTTLPYRQPYGSQLSFSKREAERPGNDDKLWVQQWLASRNVPEQIQNQKEKEVKLKISDVKNKVRRLNDIIQELEVLNSGENPDKQKINSLKTEATEITSFLEASKPQMTILLDHRMKRRSCEKIKRQKRKLEKEKMVLDRQAKHRQIDAWLQEQQEKVEKAKREEETRQQADAVLCEVRLKQSYGKSLLQVLDSLKKLRHLRAQAAADKKLYPSEEENERFNIMIGKLEDLWQLQLTEYGKEEQTLKVMMEEEKVIRQEKEQPSSFEKNLKLWLRALFGKEGSCVSDYEHFYHNSAEQDVNSLITIRQCWDQFLVSKDNLLASSVPVGWIVPCKPTSEDWMSLLKVEK